MQIAAINHIEVDERGVAYIAGTRMKVHILVGQMQVNHFTFEQLLEGYPSLSLAQLHAALAYYYDHKDEIDQYAERVREESRQMQAADERTHPERYARLREKMRQYKERQQAKD
ncbi:MAG: DUF433 domain-containing protein [Phycisphaeraceae bacterium]